MKLKLALATLIAFLVLGLAVSSVALAPSAALAGDDDGTGGSSGEAGGDGTGGGSGRE